MADRCDCCDLPEASCGRAAEKRQQAELARWRRFPGNCRRCGTPFKPATFIFTSNRSAPYLAECCAPEAPR